MKCPLCGTLQDKSFVKENKQSLVEFNKNKKQKISKGERVTISQKAIDRLSFMFIEVYIKHRLIDEGIVHWIHREAMEFLNSGQLVDLTRDVEKFGIRWIFKKSKKSSTYILKMISYPKNKKPNNRLFGPR